MGSIYRRRGPDGTPRGPYYIGWVDGRGQQRTESTKQKGKPNTGTSHAAAKRLLAEREAAVAKGANIHAGTGKRLFTECLQDVVVDQEANERRDIRHTRRRIDLHLAPYFAGLRIGEITSARVSAYAAKRKEAGAEAATINRELALIRRALRLAARNGDIITAPHVSLLDESRNARQGIIEPRDFARVLAHLAPAYADVAAVASVTGWRLVSEVLPLKWGQVDLLSGLIRIDPGQTKGGEGRSFPVTAQLRRIFEKRRPKGRKATPPAADALIFTEADGQPITPKRLYAEWHTAATAAGFPDLIPHDLRRSAVREMERRRIPRQVAMKLVGHRTESIFRRYAIILESDIHEAGSRLSAPAEKPTPRKRR
jgi:integrase